MVPLKVKEALVYVSCQLFPTLNDCSARLSNSKNIVKLPHVGIGLHEFVASTSIKNCRLHCVCTIWSVCHVWDGES